MQVVEYNFLHLLVHLLLLTENHVALPLNRRVLEFRVLEDVADDVYRLPYVLAEALRVIHGLFTRRVRIKVRAEILHLELKSMLAAFAGTLERHMLEEVCRAIGLVRLRPRASIDPDTDGRSLRMRVRLRCDSQAIRERSGLSKGTRDIDRRRERTQRPLQSMSK